MNKLFKLNKQEQGYSLAGVLIIFIVATVLGMSIVALSVNSMNISNKEHDDQSAFYIAESGTTYKATQVETKVESARVDTEKFIKDVIEDPVLGASYVSLSEDEINEIIKDKFYELLDEELDIDEITFEAVYSDYDDFDPIKGHDPFAELDITVDLSEDNPRTYTIKSKGFIGDETRTVLLPISIEWHRKPQYAILTEEKLTIEGAGGESHGEMAGKGIIGDIGSLDTSDGAIEFSNQDNPFEGNIFVPEGNENPVKNNGTVSRPNPEPLDENTSLPKLPDFPFINRTPNVPSGYVDKGNISPPQSNTPTEYVISDNDFFNELNIAGGNNIVLKVGNSEKNIFVNKFNVNNGNLVIDGDGPLNIYVRKDFSLASGTVNAKELINNVHASPEKGDSSKLNIYFEGPEEQSNNKITLGDSGILYGSLFAHQADLTVPGGAGISGNILTGGKNIKYEGGAQTEAQLILAPEAHFEHRNGDIEGMIATKSYKITSGTLKYKEPDLEGPLSLDEIMADSNNVDNTFMQRPDPTIERESVREK